MDRRSCTPAPTRSCTGSALIVALLVLVVAQAACRSGSSTPRKLNLYPTPTSEATQTPIIQTVVTTKVVQITSTPVPTFTKTPKVVRHLCISATETVYLRPSPSMKNYPITQLANGVRVTDLGGKDGVWVFVEVGDERGWINGKYVKEC